ncbi:YdcF family protein [Aneurinibacillus uraniidurans]|uniref:YdcF family protein n=1 Tax=Aneurinibacillus uraniidurans TaxID=2966586 RepID=UPI00234A6813|nr:YdcF family protein [Aneurinibacillus sp. B1]WCN38745.1 YdcF family protein [Aneurinibacillus sp. B1]
MRSRKQKISKRVLLLLLLLLVLVAGYTGWAYTKMKEAASRHAEPGLPYMIVLGAAVRGETMSWTLQNRMETALAYLRTNPQTKVIVSGGQGEGENVTEASAMQKFLLANGIASERILLEDKSTSTAKNIRFSHKLLTGNRVVLVTSDFHAYRALWLAGREGMQADILTAPTPPIVRMQLWAREYIALGKSFLFDR